MDISAIPLLSVIVFLLCIAYFEKVERRFADII